MEQIQANFFKHIAKKSTSGKKLSDELVVLLGISKGEAYKKINSKSLLTIPQIKVLCDHFKTSFTIQGNENRSSSNINFTPFHTGKVRVKDYINSLEKFLITIASAKVSKLTCATDDVPIFHLFQYPELTAFKLHFWQMRIIDNAPFKFNMNDWDASVLQHAAKLHDLYQTIPSVEVWTKTSLLNTLDQIKYAAEAKIITDKKVGKLICNQLRSALSDIELYAINRNKSAKKEVSFDWYFYDIIGTITYLAEMDGELETFIRFNTFNTIQEENGPLCTEVKHWLENLIKDAVGFSGQGSVQRNKYLAAAYDQSDEMAEMF
jgi:hypothetical protein